MQIHIDNKQIMALFRGRNAAKVVPAAMQVVADLEEFWPLTVRQVYYQLVGGDVINNTLSNYQNVSKILVTLRRENLLPWVAFEDRSRSIFEKRGVTDLEAHIADKAEDLFGYYNRCLVQNQENYVEAWVEKDALSSIVSNACWKYCIRVVVSRGQVSADFIHKYADRAAQAQAKGQSPVILYIGDYDPSGLRIPYSIEDKLRKHHGLKNFQLERIALTRDQIDQHRLPKSFEAIKKTDNNYRWFIDQGGDVAVEVDALHPGKLTDLIETSLHRHLDIDDMNEQKKIEGRDRSVLKKLENQFAIACDQMGIRYAISKRY